MSLNGIKLVVTRLASPARIRLSRSDSWQASARIRVLKPCDYVTGLLYIWSLINQNLPVKPPTLAAVFD